MSLVLNADDVWHRSMHLEFSLGKLSWFFQVYVISTANSFTRDTKSFISCSEMLHAMSVQRSRCICSFWPEYLSANLWNVWCRINIKSRFEIHGWAKEIWSSLFSLPICRSINVLMLDDLDYEDRLSSFYSKEKELSIKCMNEDNDILLNWLLARSVKSCA